MDGHTKPITLVLCYMEVMTNTHLPADITIVQMTNE